MSNSKQPIAFFGHVPVLLDLLALLNQGLSLFGLHLSLHGPGCWWAGGPCQCSLVQLQLLVGDEKHEKPWEKLPKTKNLQEPALLCSNCTTFAWNHPPSTGPPRLGMFVPFLRQLPGCRWKVGAIWAMEALNQLCRRRGTVSWDVPALLSWSNGGWDTDPEPMIYSFNPNHPPRSSNIKQFWAMMRWRKRKKKRRPMTARAFIVLGKWPK